MWHQGFEMNGAGARPLWCQWTLQGKLHVFLNCLDLENWLLFRALTLRFASCRAIYRTSLSSSGQPCVLAQSIPPMYVHSAQMRGQHTQPHKHFKVSTGWPLLWWHRQKILTELLGLMEYLTPMGIKLLEFICLCTFCLKKKKRFKALSCIYFKLLYMAIVQQ